MTIFYGKDLREENIDQSDGDRDFIVAEDSGRYQITVRPSNGATGTLLTYIQCCDGAVFEKLYKEGSLEQASIDLSDPESIRFSAWIHRIRISPQNIVGSYSINIKQGL